MFFGGNDEFIPIIMLSSNQVPELLIAIDELRNWFKVNLKHLSAILKLTSHIITISSCNSVTIRHLITGIVNHRSELGSMSVRITTRQTCLVIKVFENGI